MDEITQSKGEIIQYPSVSSDSYYFSNNTNIYPIQSSSDEVSKSVVETTYFNRNQVMNLISTLSTFDGSLPEKTMSINLHNKEINYSVLEFNNKKIVVAEKLVDSVIESCKIGKFKIYEIILTNLN